MAVQYTLRRMGRPPRYPNHIREHRLKLGFTQAQLAGSAGTGRSIISHLERGRSLPTLLHAFRIARMLSTSTEALYPDLFASA